MAKQKLLLPTLFMLLGLGILCGLGYWQLQRLEWKRDHIAKLEAEYAKDVSQSILAPADVDGDFDYKRGTLRGTYDFEKQITVGPRVYQNLPGKHVYTPFRLEDGSFILVNRGWVPNKWQSTDEAPWERAADQNGSIVGLIRAPEEKPFSPPNEPAQDKWYTANPAELAEAKSIPDMHSHVFYLEGPETEGTYPIPSTFKPEFANNHLQYAMFWFAMAGVMFVIYCLRFLRKQ